MRSFVCVCVLVVGTINGHGCVEMHSCGNRVTSEQGLNRFCVDMHYTLSF